MQHELSGHALVTTKTHHTIRGDTPHVIRHKFKVNLLGLLHQKKRRINYNLPFPPIKPPPKKKVAPIQLELGHD